MTNLEFAIQELRKHPQFDEYDKDYLFDSAIMAALSQECVSTVLSSRNFCGTCNEECASHWVEPVPSDAALKVDPFMFDRIQAALDGHCAVEAAFRKEEGKTVRESPEDLEAMKQELIATYIKKPSFEFAVVPDDLSHPEIKVETLPTSDYKLQEEINRFDAVLKEVSELHARKAADYGDSFHQTFLEEGMAAARLRITDKINRFKMLTKKGSQEVKDESVRDTLLDCMGYIALTIMELDSSSNTLERV